MTAPDDAFPPWLFAATIAALVGVASCSGAPTFSRYGDGEAPRDGAGAGGGGGTGNDGGSGGEIIGTGGSGAGGIIGSGGTTGDGGSVGSGGGPGTGGRPGSGGNTGSGGSSTGGSVGTGGAGTGGRGSGGASTGGSGTGGSVGSGGAVGTGGSGTAGMPGTGGRIGTGGTVGTGGGTGTGGSGPIVISVDFVGGSSTPAPAMTATETAGAKPATNWNSAVGVMGSIANLVAFGGTQTGAMLTWNSPTSTGNPGMWRINYPDVAGNQRMMNGYLDPTVTASPATIAVSGLPTTVTSRGYDVYVYAMSDPASGDTRTYNYSITGMSGTFSVRQTGPTSTSAFPGFTRVTTSGGTGNYFIFRNLTTASFTLTATPGTPTSRPRAPVNGIQIVSPTGS